MQSKSASISNWGLYPRREARVFSPENRAEIQEILRQEGALIARGNGRCYGDAALGERVLSTLHLNKILEFDDKNGLMHCEAGVLLSDIIPVIVSKGWFFPVTPGTKLITVGGAIAADVHGKNHPIAGCWSDHLLHFDLMVENGAILRCSKSENADLFWKTCGGLGWTGIILSACFQLKPLNSTQIHQKTIRLAEGSFSDFFSLLEENKSFENAAGWLDFSAKKLRGAVFFGSEAKDSAAPLSYPGKKRQKSIFEKLDLYAPAFLLNRWSIRAYNAWYYLTHPSGEKAVDMDQYYYPLDSMGPWNRLYGRRGMIQFQFCLPTKNAVEGFENIEKIIRDSAEVPFLSVLKKHGKRPDEAINSFPIEGYSLALDFPRTAGIFNLIHELDACLDRFDGKIYLVKDACSAGHLGRVNPHNFPSSKFVSDLKTRISHA